MEAPSRRLCRQATGHNIYHIFPSQRRLMVDFKYVLGCSRIITFRKLSLLPEAPPWRAP